MSEMRCQVLVDMLEEYRDRVDVQKMQRAVQSALAVAGSVIPRAEVSIRVTNDIEIQALNRTYRHIDKPTDVLSFSFLDNVSIAIPQPTENWPTPLGEIVLSFPYVERQSADLGHSVDKELAWLAIHGTLQLIGYTHETDEDAERMETLEQKALREAGFDSE